MKTGQYSEQIRTLAEMIRPIRIAMLTTVGPDASLRSRPMVTQQTDFDGDLWFLTAIESGKMHEIERDQHVNVAFVDPARNCYISASGTASIVVDPAKVREIWDPMHRAWFPLGPSDPSVALFRVEVHLAEYWDASSGRMVQLYEIARAAETPRRVPPGEERKSEIDTANPDIPHPTRRVEREP